MNNAIDIISYASTKVVPVVDKQTGGRNDCLLPDKLKDILSFYHTNNTHINTCE